MTNKDKKDADARQQFVKKLATRLRSEFTPVLLELPNHDLGTLLVAVETDSIDFRRLVRELLEKGDGPQSSGRDQFKQSQQSENT